MKLCNAQVYVSEQFIQYPIQCLFLSFYKPSLIYIANLCSRQSAKQHRVLLHLNFEMQHLLPLLPLTLLKPRLCIGYYHWKILVWHQITLCIKSCKFGVHHAALQASELFRNNKFKMIFSVSPPVQSTIVQSSDCRQPIATLFLVCHLYIFFSIFNDLYSCIET